MTRVSATNAGHATPRMRDYYAAFADGGFGLVITEGIYTDRAYSQGYLNQPGLADEGQRDAWRTVVDGVRVSQDKVNDFEHRWAGREEDADILFRLLGPHADYIHATEYEA